MVETVQERGGLISYKATSAGEIPYEMNINYLSALAPPALPDAQRARIFLAAQSVMLSLAGVPGIYYHSLIGSENWQEGVEQTGRNRSINRRRLDYDAISDELNREGSLANLVFEGYKALLRARAASRAFHPAGGQHVLLTPQGALAILRTSPDGSVRVLCLVNVSSDSVECSFDHQVIGTLQEKGFRDLLSGDYVYPSYDGAGRISISLEPYEVLWLA
jgi:sucrose phosphorylase